MSSYNMVEIAFGDITEVKSAAEKLLDEKLVASCHIIKSDSVWNWRGEREQAEEYLLQLKTRTDKLESVFKVIKEFHSYECFEFAVYDFTSMNARYLNWIDDELK